jgi:AraC-like DNA-binding protein
MKLIAQFGLFNGLVVLLLIMAYSFRRSVNKISLGLSIFFVWYTLFVVVMTLTKQILHYPSFHRTGIISAYLAIPFLYIYSRNSFYPGKFWRNTDWIFLLPAVFYIIDYMPFFTMPAEQKIAILQANLESNERIFLAGEGWIGLNGLYFTFAYVWIAIIMYFQARLLIINRKNKSGFKSSHNRRLFNFIVSITILYVPILIPGLFGILFNFSWFNPHFIGFTFGLSLSAVSVYLFISPDILYGFIPERKFSVHVAAIAQKTEPRQSRLVSDSQIEEMPLPETKETVTDIPQPVASDAEIAAQAEIVDRHMKEQKPFLKLGFSIQDLSNQTGIPVYQLSPLINGHFKKNFANWVNGFRIEHFIELIPGHSQLTLEALSKQAGFTSRSTFINSFKKEKGITPREFFKGQKLPA